MLGLDIDYIVISRNLLDEFIRTQDSLLHYNHFYTPTQYDGELFSIGFYKIPHENVFRIVTKLPE